MSGIDDTCVLRARGLRKQYGSEAGRKYSVIPSPALVRAWLVSGLSGCAGSRAGAGRGRRL